MAVLSANARQQIWRGLMRYWSRDLTVIPNVTKTDLQAAVDAADAWVDAAASSYNSALPAAFRSNATTAQKAFLLVVVVLARSDVALLRQIMGEVD